MKKSIIYVGTVLLIAFVVQSCQMLKVPSTAGISNASVPKFEVQVPEFTSVEKVIDLKMNSTLSEVISVLGCKPYNVYSSQVDGYTIYVYKYKIVERRVDASMINSIGGETIGTKTYANKENDLFLFFKNGKLDSFITTDGRISSPVLIMLNNSIYTVSSEKGNIQINPVSVEQVSTVVNTESNSSKPSEPANTKRSTINRIKQAVR